MQRTFMARRVALLVLVVLLVGGAGWMLGSGMLFAGSAEKEIDEGPEVDALTDMSEVELTNMSAPVDAVQDDAEPEPEPEQQSAPAVTDDDEWLLRLASAVSPLPEGYAPPELETITDGYQVDSRIASDLRRMIADAKTQDIVLMICSAYRSEEYQSGLYNNKIAEHVNLGYSDEEAAALAATIVLPPGTSEHQTGLAVDIVTPDYQVLDDGFVETPAARWLAENSWQYGFVLRYPQDKQSITDIIYEPWHFRYVGYDHAKIMYENNYCLEEYLFIERNSLQPGLPVSATPEDGAGEEDGGE